jgi:ABC-type sulfate transport system substrate-binding protein
MRPRQKISSRSYTPNVPVFDSGARGSTTTFVERGIGDVPIAREKRGLDVNQASRSG